MEPELLSLFPSEEPRQETVELEIFHDEMLDDAEHPFAHQFLFVPLTSKQPIFRVLEDIRLKCNSSNMTINWKNISQRNQSRFLTGKQWLSIFVQALYRRGSFRYPLRGGEVLDLGQSLGVKSATFLIDSRDQLDERYWNGSTISLANEKYLTIFKIGIKGALHFLYNPADSNISNVVIKKLYTDGEQCNSLPLAQRDILNELGSSLRSHITIEDSNLVFTPKSRIKTPEVDILELTDLVLGSTIYLGRNTQDDRKIALTSELRNMYNKRNRSRGFTNSGHFQTFTVSKASVDPEIGWSFDQLDTNMYPDSVIRLISEV